jgi:predicted dehydrogenase
MRPEVGKNELPVVAVLGTGSIGMRHLTVLRDLGVQTIAIPARPERVSELTNEGWNAVETIEQAQALGAGAAIIATDTNRHVIDCREALLAGLHVLVEKPMATTSIAAKELIDIAKQKLSILAVGCCLRFDPGLWELKDKIHSVGRIHAARIECRSYLPEWRPTRIYRQSYSARLNEGGVLRDLIHEIDYAIWFFGVPTRVTGTLLSQGHLGIESEELAEGFWETSEGVIITLGLDYLTRTPHRRFVIFGDRGNIEYDLITRRLLFNGAMSGSWERRFPRFHNDIYTYQALEFLNAVRGGEPSRLALGEDGVAALAVCDAWRQSSSTRRASEVIL